jgi:hypothetical protein
VYSRDTLVLVKVWACMIFCNVDHFAPLRPYLLSQFDLVTPQLQRLSLEQGPGKMGIPGLMKDLAPYREQAILGYKAKLEGRVNISALVIDGPSFVYDVYRRQMDSVAHLEAPLAYRDINEAVVDLLDVIRSHGIEM